MLESTGLDKILHFVVSFGIGLADPVLAIFAGLGKEVYDVARGGTADLGDLIADWWGVLFAVIL